MAVVYFEQYEFTLFPPENEPGLLAVRIDSEGVGNHLCLPPCLRLEIQAGTTTLASLVEHAQFLDRTGFIRCDVRDRGIVEQPSNNRDFVKLYGTIHAVGFPVPLCAS